MPAVCSVAPVVVMIANATRLENAIPMDVSTRIRCSADGPCRGSRTSGSRSGTALISSTSCDACQKNRYGLIVVPRIATTVVQKLTSEDGDGTNKPCGTSAHGT